MLILRGTVIQEVSLTNNRAKIYFGNQFSDFSALFNAVIILQSDLRGFESTYPPEMGDLFESALANIQSFLVYNSLDYSEILPLLNAGRRAK